MAADAPWTEASVPSQSGRTALVTGANSGTGFEIARVLATQGARVLLGCRDSEKGKEAVSRIRAACPQAQVSDVSVDLADLESVAACAQAVSELTGKLDLLVNNAGVMVPPLSRTRQGFELQFGTNHLGHFALTARLWPQLAGCPEARVTTVTSIASRFGRVELHDMQFQQRRYKPWDAYGFSKLANLLFALELARRLEASGAAARSTVAHPGITATGLQRHSSFLRNFVNPLVMKAPQGALPILRAATDALAGNGSYWGPSHLFETRGRPVPAQLPRSAYNLDAARRLWELSEELAGVRFPLARAAVPNA